LTKSDNSKSKKNAKLDTFTINNQGRWVAVAYVFCIGSDKFRGDNNSVLNRAVPSIYRWPRTDDVAEVQSELILLLILG